MSKGIKPRKMGSGRTRSAETVCKIVAPCELPGSNPGLPTKDWYCSDCKIMYEVEPGIRPPCTHYKGEKK